jgi:hypothetical protein
MSENYLDYDISKVRKGDSKLRIRKNGFGTYLVATVVNGVEGYTFAIDPDDMPNIIRASTECDAEAIIKELDKLPVTLTLVEN